MLRIGHFSIAGFHSLMSRFSSHFSTSRTSGPRSLSQTKAGTHSAFGEESHTRAHTAKQALFRMGVVSLPSDRSARFGNPAWPGIRTASFAALGSWPGGALEERRKPSGQRCAYACRCPEGVAAPLGCVIFFRICRNSSFHALHEVFCTCMVCLPIVIPIWPITCSSSNLRTAHFASAFLFLQ